MLPPIRVLIVDDDKELAGSVGEYLRLENFESLWAADTQTAGRLLDTDCCDIVVLDVTMPGESGFELLRRLRHGSAIPVIMLTARAEELDRVLGLELGADDYLTKPFHLRELAARIRAVMRRLQPREGIGLVRVGPVSLDRRALSAEIDGRPVRLTSAEFMVLDALMREPGNVISRASLTESALGRSLEPYDRSIDTHVSNLRRKLDLGAAESVQIRSIRGRGYILSAQGDRP